MEMCMTTIRRQQVDRQLMVDRPSMMQAKHRWLSILQAISHRPQLMAIGERILTVKEQIQENMMLAMVIMNTTELKKLY